MELVSQPTTGGETIGSCFWGKMLLLLLSLFLLVSNCLTVARVIIMITLVITLGDAIEIRI
jgi:hypothetical protein